MKPTLKLFSVLALAASLGSALLAQPPQRLKTKPDDRAPSPQKPPQTPRIKPESQLMITDLRVVEDPVRTNPRMGPRAAWTFKHLIENMAGRQNPSDFAMQWLRQWETDFEVNGSVAPARAAIRSLVIEPWLKASGGRRLDLAKAPFKLLAIVNRMDLRVHDGGQVANAGEGRFVFGVLGADGKPLPPLFGDTPGGFTVIFEYGLVATNMDQLRSWAMSWAELGRYPLGSAAYNHALERVTRRFTDRGAAPLKPNGSSLNQLRTNELSLAVPWELREFAVDSATGHLQPRSVALTPDVITLNGTPNLAELINTNEAGLLAETFAPADELQAASALAGPFQLTDFPNSDLRSFTVLDFFAPFVDVPWSAAGIRSNDARHAFALNTCGGCHRSETGTLFLQIAFPANHKLPRSLGTAAELAGFLTGIDTPDPVEPATTRSFGDLARRQKDLEELLATFGSSGRGPGPRGRHVPNFVH